MALKRESLKAMGLNEEQISAIVEMHMETVTGIQEELKAANKKVEQFNEMSKKLNEYENGEDWKKKYEDEHGAFESFKKETEENALKRAKVSAYTEVLKDCKISGKRIQSIIKVTDFSKIDLDKDGHIKGLDKVKEEIATEWADFVETESERGADVPNPPSNNGGNAFTQMSLADKMRYANEHPNDQSVRDWLNSKN